jgi:carbonic anhydrase
MASQLSPSSTNLKKMLDLNKNNYAANFQSPPPIMALLEKVRPTRAGIIVISCSDPRLDPTQMFGNDKAVRATHVRNAGGRAADALRSLAVLGSLSNPGMVVVVHHTGTLCSVCGTAVFSATDGHLSEQL